MRYFTTEQEAIEHFDKKNRLMTRYLYITGFFFIPSVFFVVPITPIGESRVGLFFILIAISIIISPIIYLIFFRDSTPLSFLLIWICGIFWANFIVFCIFLFTPIQSISGTITDIKIDDVKLSQSSPSKKECHIQVNTHDSNVNQYRYKVDCDNQFEINQIITLDYKQNFLGIVSAD